MRVAVAVALPGRQEVIAVELGDGSTVADAIAAARVFERFPQLDAASVALGVTGAINAALALRADFFFPAVFFVFLAMRLLIYRNA